MQRYEEFLECANYLQHFNKNSACIRRKHHVRLLFTRVSVCDGNAMNVR